jgi:cyclophilin family peptidyl-prolyl cis-trans isomerase
MMRLSGIFMLFMLISCTTKKETQVVLHTTMGDIRVRLYDDVSRHREWFLQYVHQADTTIFYRVWRDHLIQFGLPPEKTVRIEMPDHDTKHPLCNGALAAVDAKDKSVPTRGADFFIVQGSPKLSGQYTVFGQVTEGMEVVNRIAAVPHREDDRPIEDIRVRLQISQ